MIRMIRWIPFTTLAFGLLLVASDISPFAIDGRLSPLHMDKPAVAVPGGVALPAVEPVLPEPKPQEEITPVVTLDEVNDVSLYDDRAAVVEKKGVPLEIVEDPDRSDLEIYRYADMEVAFSGRLVDSLSVLTENTTAQFEVDGIPVESTPESIHRVLGTPDFVADDGLVYQRGEALLKVYLEPGRNNIVIIRYYSMANV
jgi:hypothetical protein